jgi:AbrB family looped-hinge helix DNA binding protein
MTRLSRKNQITVPVEILRRAGLAAGDELEVRVVAPGRLEVARRDDLVARHAGKLSGVYPPGYLQELRNEWER